MDADVSPAQTVTPLQSTGDRFAGCDAVCDPGGFDGVSSTPWSARQQRGRPWSTCGVGPSPRATSPTWWKRRFVCWTSPAWHLSYDTSRYRFQTEPNPRKIVGDEKVGVLASVVREELNHRIGVMFTSAGPVKVKIFPHGPSDIDDKPELRLAVIHYDDLTVDARTASPTPLQIGGHAGPVRSWRGRTGRIATASYFWSPTPIRLMQCREAVRYHLAAQRIVSDGQRMAGLCRGGAEADCGRSQTRPGWMPG